jgi:ATP-binding cassette, subfamily B (MDR/TAP), member 1
VLSGFQPAKYEADTIVAGLFPGQAILMANMVDVFTLPAPEMISRGDLFSAMFVVIASACLFSYYAMGWGTNTLAQVLVLVIRSLNSTNLTFSDIGTQPA